MDAAQTTPGFRFRPRPAWLVWASPAATGFLYLSERYGWFAFNQHKGWTVLIALGGVLAVLLILLLWWLAALVFSKKWRFQFDIKDLLLLTLAAALPLSWLAVEMKKARRQKEIVAEIVELGGSVYFDWQFQDNTPAGGAAAEPEPPGTARLRDLLGDDFFQSVEVVDLQGPDVTDDTLDKLAGWKGVKRLLLLSTRVSDRGLANVAGMTGLKLLWLNDTGVSDAGLKHLRGLKLLKSLYLGETHVTDAGLKELRGLTALEVLSLDGTQVTDAGLDDLRGLPTLQELRLRDTKVTDAGLEKLKQFPALGWVDLRNTQISDEAVDRLQQARLQQGLPKCIFLY